MEFIIRGSAKEIADLAAQSQGRQEQSIAIGSPKPADGNGNNFAKKNSEGIKMKGLAWCG